MFHSVAAALALQNMNTQLCILSDFEGKTQA